MEKGEDDSNDYKLTVRKCRQFKREAKGMDRERTMHHGRCSPAAKNGP